MTSESPRSRPKGDKRARTRAALLEAALELVRERGHERTTLDEVARRAGMTSGAIYGNFKNRDELFIALGQAYWPAIRPVIPPGSSFAQKMRAFAEATLAAIPERQPVAAGHLTGMAYALRHEGLGDKVREATTASYAWGADWLRSIDEGDLPMPPDILVAVIHSLTEGLVFQRLLTPELVPDEAFYAAFAALAGERSGGA